MATLRNERKIAALNKENCAEHPRSNLAQNTNVPRSQGDYITQVSEKIKYRVTTKLSQEFSRTKNRILGALSRLDEFSSEPTNSGRLRIHSGDIPKRSWHKSGNEWRRFPEWSSYWSEGLSEPDYAKFWPRWPLRQFHCIKVAVMFSNGDFSFTSVVTINAELFSDNLEISSFKTFRWFILDLR